MGLGSENLSGAKASLGVFGRVLAETLVNGGKDAVGGGKGRMPLEGGKGECLWM